MLIQPSICGRNASKASSWHLTRQPDLRHRDTFAIPLRHLLTQLALRAKVDAAAMKALKRGWYLGEPEFRARLLDLFAGKPVTRRRAGDAVAAHGEAAAERLAVAALAAAGLPADLPGLTALRKGDPGKVRVASFLRGRTAVKNDWIAKRLAMGHPGSVSRLVAASRKDPAQARALQKMEQMLKCKS